MKANKQPKTVKLLKCDATRPVFNPSLTSKHEFYLEES